MKGIHLLRVGYSFFGLLAGDAVLLILILLNALRASLISTAAFAVHCAFLRQYARWALGGQPN